MHVIVFWGNVASSSDFDFLACFGSHLSSYHMLLLLLVLLSVRSIYSLRFLFILVRSGVNNSLFDLMILIRSLIFHWRNVTWFVGSNFYLLSFFIGLESNSVWLVTIPLLLLRSGLNVGLFISGLHIGFFWCFVILSISISLWSSISSSVAVLRILVSSDVLWLGIDISLFWHTLNVSLLWLSISVTLSRNFLLPINSSGLVLLNVRIIVIRSGVYNDFLLLWLVKVVIGSGLHLDFLLWILIVSDLSIELSQSSLIWVFLDHSIDGSN